MTVLPFLKDLKMDTSPRNKSAFLMLWPPALLISCLFDRKSLLSGTSLYYIAFLTLSVLGLLSDGYFFVFHLFHIIVGNDILQGMIQVCGGGNAMLALYDYKDVLATLVLSRIPIIIVVPLRFKTILSMHCQ